MPLNPYRASSLEEENREEHFGNCSQQPAGPAEKGCRPQAPCRLQTSGTEALLGSSGVAPHHVVGRITCGYESRLPNPGHQKTRTCERTALPCQLDVRFVSIDIPAEPLPENQETIPIFPANPKLKKRSYPNSMCQHLA